MAIIKFLKIVLLFSLIGCSTQAIIPHIDHSNNSGVKNTIERARVLSDIQWIPLKDLEYNNGGIYKCGSHVSGVPYSSVKETQTYIGHDVSLYTFITSTMNPSSLIYTESIDKPPYNGTNCKLYYGVVCSSAVMYALGIDIPYSTLLFKESDLFIKCDRQSPADIFLCSILLEPGHMLMIVGIDKDSNNNIVSVDLFESSQSGTRIYKVSYDQFCKRWINNEIVQYEYKNIRNNTEPVNFISDIDILNQDITSRTLEICPSKGDKSSYTINEDVIVNILNMDNYNSVDLYSKGTFIKSYDISSISEDTIVYSNLPPGEYSTRLSNNHDYHSSWAYFEVLDNSTVIDDIGDKVRVEFKSINAVPEFISFNSGINGAALSFFEVTETEDDMWIPIEGRERVNIRVGYKGKYGRVFFQQELQ